MNVKLLRKIQKHILDEPRRFAMDVWCVEGRCGETLRSVHSSVGHGGYNAGNKYERLQIIPSCGTVACIGGWGEQLDPNHQGLGEMGTKLISASRWPKNYRDRYRRAKTPLTRARIASERIDHFIKAKGRE